MNSVKTAALLALLTGLLVAMGRYFGGNTGMLVMLFVSLGFNFFSYWNSDKMVLKAYDAVPVTESESPELYHIVAKLAKNAKLPMPKVYIIHSDVPNAFATGRNPEHAAVAVTTGIMQLLTDDEIEGVLAHELTHVKHRDTLISTVAASIAGVIVTISNMLQIFAIFGGRDSRDNNNPVALLATIILAPIAASLIQMGISRSREYLADAGGAEISKKPLALASALAKIEHYSSLKVLPNAKPTTASLFIINPLGHVGSFMSNMFSTHPTTKSRIEKLKEIAAKQR